jgi:alkylated DNA repair protein (DNA oxidative demethylase)
MGASGELFAELENGRPRREQLRAGALVLRGFAVADSVTILTELPGLFAQAPLRHMMTPGGFRMSVSMSNCGALGWVTDRSGYRYTPVDPESGRPWPAMPAVLTSLAKRAAQEAGYGGFVPDACLINRYQPGARLTLHQDRNERDFVHPVVSVSLGLAAVFQFGGARRADRAVRVPLGHGDIVVWGGESRLSFHGVLPLGEGTHPDTGPCRINLTFRRAG